MDIHKLLEEIIPPNDYKHREGFTNHSIIDKLNTQDKELLEAELINKLLKSDDSLIVETLAYIKSKTSLPVLKKLLDNSTNPEGRLILSSSIYQIEKNEELIDIAIKAFKEISNSKKDAYYVYRMLRPFYYLKIFENLKINKVIEEYTTHPEYLISYNAKQALNKS